MSITHQEKIIMSHKVEIDLQGSKISLETGKIAKQANGSVVVSSGESVVLVTVCSTEKPKPGASFFPLTVDYREYMYAAGKFPDRKSTRLNSSHANISYAV